MTRIIIISLVLLMAERISSYCPIFYYWTMCDGGYCSVHIDCMGYTYVTKYINPYGNQYIPQQVPTLISPQPTQIVIPNDEKYPKDCGDTPLYNVPNIIGGNEIQPDEFSWAASLQYYKYGQLCGGSVVNSLYVLTAAHCIEGEQVDEYGGLVAVRLGDFSQRETCDYGLRSCGHYQSYGISKKILHNGFNAKRRDTFHNDIALIKLDRTITFTDKLKPICLPFGYHNIRRPQISESLYVTGWGKTEEAYENIAKRRTIINLWSNSKCKKVNPLITDSQLCASSPNRGACRGDSGGPLMFRFENKKMSLEGIVSSGPYDCRDRDLPGIFTSVRSFEDWIDSNMCM